MIVDSNAPAPLKYTDPTYQPSLFVRALILDLSGGSPVLENTVNLSQYSTSAVYNGKYSFTAGKPYQVIKNAYTDGTYATIDTNYPQDTDEFQCIDLKTANLDAAISTRLATAGYTAPDNADIVAIKAKTDNLPADPASNTQVLTRLAAGSYVAPDNADIALIKAKTDNLPADPASNTQVNTRLASADARLNNLDATISSRLPTSSYVAPDNSDIAAIKVKTDNLPVSPASEPNVTAVGNAVSMIPTNPLLTNDSRLANLDATVSSRLPTSSYVAPVTPDNAGIAAIKAKTDLLTFTGTDVHSTSSGGGGSSTSGGTIFRGRLVNPERLSGKILNPQRLRGVVIQED